MSLIFMSYFEQCQLGSKCYMSVCKVKDRLPDSSSQLLPSFGSFQCSEAFTKANDPSLRGSLLLVCSGAGYSLGQQAIPEALC